MKKKKKEEERRNSIKIYMVSLLHRATIKTNILEKTVNMLSLEIYLSLHCVVAF